MNVTDARTPKQPAPLIPLLKMSCRRVVRKNYNIITWPVAARCKSIKKIYAFFLLLWQKVLQFMVLNDKICLKVVKSGEKWLTGTWKGGLLDVVWNVFT
jgi:hypothetical protein